MPDYGVTTEGWESKPLETIHDEINAAIWAGVSPTVNLSSTSLLGQKIGAVASQLRQLWEAGAANYASLDAEQAEGDALDARCRLTGTERQPASASTALVTLTLASGTYEAHSIVLTVSGSPNIRFDNDVEIVGTGVQLVGQLFTCQTEGAIVVNPNTLTQIANNPGGGVSGPTNPAAAATGVEREIDRDLRVRRVQSLARTGSGTVDAIRADLLAVTSVQQAKVIENETDATVASVPPHTIAAYVLGGSSADIAEALWLGKGAGVGTYGSTTVNYTDTQGAVHAVNYTVPTEVRVYVACTATVLTGSYPASADDTIADAIWNAQTRWNGSEDTAESDSWGIGEDLLINKIRAAIMRVPGIVDITSLTIDTVDPPVGTVNLVISVSQYADIDLADIDVTENYVTAVP